MKTNPKIIAMYLPQYHRIPENDEFWGDGFTDWVTVRRALPLFSGHQQPKIPYNSNYYDLSEKNNIEWQARLARENGIYGFGIYHYWFNNDKNILTKPAEIILENKDIDINYFFAWDNSNWKRSWSNVAGNDWAPAMEQGKRKKGEPTVLISYILGEEDDWVNHYHWLKPFFLDKRYIKKDNKPVFIIFNYTEQIFRMCNCWNELAKEDGFDGMFFIFRNGERYHIPELQNKFKYEPLYSGWSKPLSFMQRVEGKIKRTLRINDGPKKFCYDDVWTSILRNAQKMNDKGMYHGAFVTYDDTPRRGKRGTVVIGSSPIKFQYYLSELVKISANQGKDYVFLTAWNEWGEGAYLEPDSKNGYAYLEALRQVKLK